MCKPLRELRSCCDSLCIYKLILGRIAVGFKRVMSLKMPVTGEGQVWAVCILPGSHVRAEGKSPQSSLSLLPSSLGEPSSSPCDPVC